MQGWQLDTTRNYQPLVPNEKNWLWCHLGFWSGTIERETAVWVRFYDQARNLVLLPEEAERQRALALAARLREIGEPDTLGF